MLMTGGHPQNVSLAEKLDVGRFSARYSLISLLQQKPREVVRLIELEDVALVIRPTPPAPLAPQPPKKGGPLRILPITPQRVDIRNINVLIRRTDGDWAVRNFGINLQADQTGALTCGELSLQPLADWKNLRAGLRIQAETLHLSGLSLPPYLAIDELNVDAHQLTLGKLTASVTGKTFDAPLRIDASLDSQTNETLIVGALQITGLNLQPLQQVVSLPVTGSIPVLNLSLKGDIERPRSLGGHLVITGEQIRYRDQQVDDFGLRIGLIEGKGTIDQCVLNAGSNRVSLAGNFLLPASSNAFANELVAHIGIAAAFFEPARILPNLQFNTLVVGNAQVEGGQASALIRLFNTNLKQAGLEVPVTEATIGAVAQLPLPASIWPGCAGLVDARVNDMRRKNRSGCQGPSRYIGYPH
jgi:hypothetical protein